MKRSTKRRQPFPIAPVLAVSLRFNRTQKCHPRASSASDIGPARGRITTIGEPRLRYDCLYSWLAFAVSASRNWRGVSASSKVVRSASSFTRRARVSETPLIVPQHTEICLAIVANKNGLVRRTGASDVTLCQTTLLGRPGPARPDEVANVALFLKQFPAYLNRWDSQQARNEGVFAH